MDFLQTVLAAIVTLGILVVIHEYGHFWVARRCGVKVLRFSIGFGKGLFRWTDRYGTEYVIAAIPLGGYVKMLDEREAEVPAELLSQAFNRKSVWQRISIVSAGPVVNLAFAVIAYWCMYVSGISTVAPVIGEVVAGSIAERGGLQAGEEITRIDGRDVRAWDEVMLRLVSRIGETGEVSISAQAPDDSRTHDYRLPIKEWRFDEEAGPLEGLGIVPYRPEIPAVIGQLVAGERAEQGGLQVGDRVLRVEGVMVDDWSSFVMLIRNSMEQRLVIEVERQGGRIELMLIPGTKVAETGESFGYIGAGVQSVSWPENMKREIQYSLVGAIPQAFKKTHQMIVLTLESIGKMIQGTISVKNLSGPITIAKVASSSAQSGLETYLGFLAYLSISLGILNLLPIPILDGGHLLYYVVEAVRGRPVSERIQIMGLKLGMTLLLALMLMAIYNDITRLL
jgi:regulator of sigma E protease